MIDLAEVAVARGRCDREPLTVGLRPIVAQSGGGSRDPAEPSATSARATCRGGRRTLAALRSMTRSRLAEPLPRRVDLAMEVR
ncbi:MAG TPA: hypothetical protein DCQ98_11205 [Planctomycetaceae bacterium]|nr:hypothetical protein [Planctomycetaceae bacterium]